MCLNGTYPFLSATLVRQLPYYLFRETCFMDSYPTVVLFLVEISGIEPLLFVCLKVLLKPGGNKKDSRQAVSFRGGDKRDPTAVVCLPESALKIW